MIGVKLTRLAVHQGIPAFEHGRKSIPQKLLEQDASNQGQAV
jgi:hypothetical protein